MINLILGWRTPNSNSEVPEVVYCGNDGTEALKTAAAADKSGKYSKGKIGRAIVSHVIPFSTASAGTVPKAIAEARKAQEELTKKTTQESVNTQKKATK